ncbi:uncharacterized protein LOC111379867, partial [Olea europaea var. sylvestris]|uniref:uncharacterized protein LOC111379867 n=1 Tax=Olea europaea var. sylvestris TaxID=158386 RepID=UPI000C1D7055
MDIDSEIEAIGETPSTFVPSLPPSCLGKRKNRKPSDVWEHFTVIGNSNAEDVRCACTYCGQDYACGARKYGTSTLRNHLVLYYTCEDIEDDNFDVLNWWKVKENKYGTLSKLARDVMAIQVPTVVSEIAFSTGGRILNPFRSSLTRMMVEVL